MQFYEFVGENLKKPDEREKEDKDNHTIEIVAKQMHLLTGAAQQQAPQETPSKTPRCDPCLKDTLSVLRMNSNLVRQWTRKRKAPRPTGIGKEALQDSQRLTQCSNFAGLNIESVHQNFPKIGNSGCCAARLWRQS